MTVKINDLTIELEPGITLEASPDGKSIRIYAEPRVSPLWPLWPIVPLVYREVPNYEPYRITYGPTCAGDPLPTLPNACTST